MLNFAQMQNMVISNRFREGQRDDVKVWINSAYAYVWSLESWTFRFFEETVTITSGSTAITDVPTTLLMPLGLWNAQGDRLQHIPPDVWNEMYYGSTTTGKPEAYTITNGVLKVGPISNETSDAYLLRGEKKRTDLGTGPAGEQEESLIPAGSEMVLVHGGAEIGLVMENDPTAELQRALKEDKIAEMRQLYLVDQRDRNDQWAAYDPELEYLESI